MLQGFHRCVQMLGLPMDRLFLGWAQSWFGGDAGWNCRNQSYPKDYQSW
jgi:hypothetical protein